MTERDRGGSKAYHLFLDIVDVVARSPHALTVREIGRELNLQPALGLEPDQWAVWARPPSGLSLDRSFVTRQGHRRM